MAQSVPAQAEDGGSGPCLDKTGIGVKDLFLLGLLQTSVCVCVSPRVESYLGEKLSGAQSGSPWCLFSTRRPVQPGEHNKEYEANFKPSRVNLQIEQ